MKQYVLPVAVIVMLASILVPLPTMAMDFLLVANLILSLLLLVTTLYVNDPIKLSALPTMLLLGTLFRLALNISTTRLILSNGDAGRTVEAFGSVVVQGNIVVGLVVFLVITLVQFIVIAKGSERVAEVSARFTLDAMPGKQMSIDADVRAGLIDFESAREKRQDLQVESRFYGALDGAMKFVKGDAIAGIVIMGINLIGGLLLGMFHENLRIAQAVSKYSILTVGDGLLSQIPALLSSIGAGLVVTRVARPNGEALVTEVINQLSQVQVVKFLIGTLALLLSMTPGLPGLPFFVVATLLMISGLLQGRTKRPASETANPVTFSPKSPALLEIAVTKALARELSLFGGINEAVDRWRQRAFDKFGLLLERPTVTLLSSEGSAFTILLRGIACFRVPVAIEDQKGQQPSEILRVILEKLDEVIDTRRTELISDISTRRWLDFYDREAPELVSSVVPTIASVTQLTNILRSLAAERIPIKHFDIILQAVAEATPKATSESVVIEAVRIALRRVIIDPLVDDEGRLFAYSLDPLSDLAIARAEREQRSIDEEQFQALMSDLTAIQDDPIVVVTSRASRSFVHRCCSLRTLALKVIAHEEIPDDQVVHWKGTIGSVSELKPDLVLNSFAEAA